MAWWQDWVSEKCDSSKGSGDMLFLYYDFLMAQVDAEDPRSSKISYKSLLV